MIVLKDLHEVLLIRESSQLVSKTLGMLASEIRPNITTLYLDRIAEMFIRDHGGIPAFLGLYNFPNALCISPNEQVVHGLPNHYVLRNGDIVSIDCGVLMNGYYGEHAYTFEVGEVKNKVKKLLSITKNALYVGITSCQAGFYTGDIGYAIQNYVEKDGYGIVRELVGHGLGKKMHEDPQIPNYGEKRSGIKLVNGMVLAIEPMINQGTHKIIFHKDGWTITTADKTPSAHYEHNVAIVEGRPILLSTFKYIYTALGISSSEEDPFLL